MISASMVQLENNGVIETYNLSCQRVNEPHTAVNINRMLHEVTARYNIKDDAVLAFTADSAANVQKAASLFLKDLNSERFVVGFVNREDLQDECEESADTMGRNNNDDYNDRTTVNSVEFSEQVDIALDLSGPLPGRIIPTSFRVACVVHQEQLAINKWCESPEIRELLLVTRKIVKRLRTQLWVRKLNEGGFPLACIDQDTRWSSKFKMVERLLKLREFCEDYCAELFKGNYKIVHFVEARRLRYRWTLLGFGTFGFENSRD